MRHAPAPTSPGDRHVSPGRAPRSPLLRRRASRAVQSAALAAGLAVGAVVALATVGTTAGAAAAQATPEAQPAARDGQHDFDFEIGTWKTHLRRLLHPLSGASEWTEMEGTTVVRKVWNGRANLVELEVDGPSGHLEGASWRLYNPQSRQWSLNFANSADGMLSVPTIGEFRDGRGEFHDQETLRGRAILVRFVIQPLSADTIRFEQSLSDDGGKTWELNWIATDTRVP